MAVYLPIIALFPPNSNKLFPKKNRNKNVKQHNADYIEELKRFLNQKVTSSKLFT